MHPAVIALLAAVIPIVAVHLCYTNSLINGDVPGCIPYLEGCTSISRAARSGDSIHLFRAMMLPTTTLLATYWILVFRWLTALQQQQTKGTKAMVTLGVAGALLLILYVTFLGTEGEIYRWMRRYGVIFFFSFTALAQILLTQQLYQLNDLPSISPHSRLITAKLVLCIIQWSVGLISIPLGIIITDKTARDAMQNIVEWNFALAMYGFFLVTYLMMKETNLRISFTVNAPKNNDKPHC